mmetsp:Transcript_28098/g.74153  ORF Transcript_28098/g.74153 Transcript_28098/m.74153 type:complete len:209 (-) Transcript_28098:1363-1989(-)
MKGVAGVLYVARSGLSREASKCTSSMLKPSPACAVGVRCLFKAGLRNSGSRRLPSDSPQTTPLSQTVLWTVGPALEVMLGAREGSAVTVRWQPLPLALLRPAWAQGWSTVGCRFPAGCVAAKLPHAPSSTEAGKCLPKRSASSTSSPISEASIDMRAASARGAIPALDPLAYMERRSVWSRSAGRLAARMSAFSPVGEVADGRSTNPV